MNLSAVVTRIKLNLGLVNIATPFENVDDVIIKIIRDITVPTFSIYQPFKEHMVFNGNELELLERTVSYTRVLLPDFKTRNLLYVFDVSYYDGNTSGAGTASYFLDSSMVLNDYKSLQSLLMANVGMRMTNSMTAKPTFHFEAPRTVILYGHYISANLKFYLGFEHDKSLASIPNTCQEDFIKLAMLDVKDNLYATLKHYTEVNTAIGNINLKIDEWNDADNQRKDLLEKWDDVYHLDMQPFYYL